jgi:hypothetical protein
MQSHPTSLRARDAALRVADLMMKSGDAAAVPLLLKDLAQKQTMRPHLLRNWQSLRTVVRSKSRACCLSSALFLRTGICRKRRRCYRNHETRLNHSACIN